MPKRLSQDQPKLWARLINPFLFAYIEVPQSLQESSPFQLLYGRSVRGPGTILREIWIKEVNIPKVKTSYGYIFTELHERLENSLKLAQEELRTVIRSITTRRLNLESGSGRQSADTTRNRHHGESCGSQRLQSWSPR